MIDKNAVKQKLHDVLVGVILAGLIASPIYYFVLVTTAFLVEEKLKVKKILINVVAVVVEVMLLFGSSNYFEVDNSLVVTWLFEPTKLQLIVMILGMMVLLNFEKFIFSNHDDWMLHDEILAEKKAIPEGQFDFEDKNHVTILGTTGSGKTSLEKQIAKYHIERGNPMVIISGKSANGDPESLLAETRSQCHRTGQELMVVSLNQREASEGYNPIRRLEPETVAECLTTVSYFSEPHYEAHFKSWVQKIAQLVKFMGVEMSLSNLMTLYDYDRFLEYLEKANKDGRVTDEQMERLLNGAEENAKIARDSKERFLQYMHSENMRSVLTGKNLRCIDDVLKVGGVVFLDLHGPSYPALTKDLATFAMADLATALDNDTNPSQRKIILLDELSFTFNKLLSSLYATARSTGAQIISATQSLADLDEVSETLTEKLIENSNVFCVFRQNSAKDAERAAAVIGTKNKVKRTQKADGIRYDPAGTSQVTKEYKVHPDYIKEMKKLEYIYCNKDSGELCRGKIRFVEEDHCALEIGQNFKI